MNEHVERLIVALSDPSTYPHRPDSVRVIQTHISIVFVAGELVYKLKKPLSLGFLDFTTLEKRKFFCRQEVELNSRFSRDIYLGVVSVNESLEHGINLRDEGSEIEYAVLMRFVPDNKILKNALAQNTVEPAIIDKVADSIREFHSKASGGSRVSIFGAPEVIMQNVLENFIQTEPFIGKTIPADIFEEIKKESLGYLERNREFLEKRVKLGHIRDCHGDLHLDHVVLSDPIMLVDCIEFNDRFRYSDCLADLAFLLMDLDFSGYPGYSNRALARYMVDCPDQKAYDLLRFYQSYRAYVRGKVQSFTSNESEIDKKTRIQSVSIARDYFSLARAYFAPPPKPALMITCGLMGSGKSFLSSRLGTRLGIDIIRSDVVRKEALGLRRTEHKLDNYGTGIYTREASEMTYGVMLDEADKQLGKGRHVILDASFAKRKLRLEARDLAKRLGARFGLIHCEASDDVIHKRLVARIEDVEEPSDGRWELYHRQKDDFEKIDPREETGCVRYTPNIDFNQFLTSIAIEIAFGFANSTCREFYDND
ncbi:MAG: AAA family ATPase [Pseudomonadota bacterium]